MRICWRRLKLAQKLTLESFEKTARERFSENKKYLSKLKKKAPAKLDSVMQQLHDAEFKRTDCLTCANCCKTTGPLFTKSDVERIAKVLRLKPAAFELQYLRTDEDGDLVLQQVPCVFLDAENYCTIYEHRPKACREYPHTDRPKFHQITELTAQNTLVCPATLRIVEALKQKLPL